MPRRRPRLTNSPLATLGQAAGLFTARERAEKLGVSRSHLLQIERGCYLPSYELVKRMGKAYDIHPDQVERAAKQSRALYSQRLALQVQGLA